MSELEAQFLQRRSPGTPQQSSAPYDLERLHSSDDSIPPPIVRSQSTPRQPVFQPDKKKYNYPSAHLSPVTSSTFHFPSHGRMISPSSVVDSENCSPSLVTPSPRSKSVEMSAISKQEKVGGKSKEEEEIWAKFKQEELEKEGGSQRKEYILTLHKPPLTLKQASASSIASITPRYDGGVGGESFPFSLPSVAPRREAGLGKPCQSYPVFLNSPTPTPTYQSPGNKFPFPPPEQGPRGSFTFDNWKGETQSQTNLLEEEKRPSHTKAKRKRRSKRSSNLALTQTTLDSHNRMINSVIRTGAPTTITTGRQSLHESDLTTATDSASSTPQFQFQPTKHGINQCEFIQPTVNPPRA